MTTESFLAALERFVSRRGLPNTIYSDNGSIFIGASNVLSHSQKLLNFANLNSIRWRFIAPRSPHQGGIWEAAVKAGKACLLKAIGNQTLNFSEFNTVLSKVEAILNSRPISYRNVNQDLEPLTPGHFLVGGSLLETPISDDHSIKLNSRFRLWRNIVDSFWQSWRHDYLNQLQTRFKWKEKFPNLKVDDVVLVNSPNERSMYWPLGRIIEVFPDKEGVVRNVMVKTKDGIFKRAVQKLVLLPVND
ncbi:uncharacterized protein LOC135835969 [Planococcus citri]|uniref:uncharacterized protein LOC135835969 n=1 Tax=Planococcus citri TaxID=170843 RepID=UPI0031F89D34